MSQPMKPSDPAYWMLEEGLTDPSKRSRATAYQVGCYICDDPEFSLMGLPLCFGCHVCGEHVAADDSICGECGHDHSEPPEPDIRQATAWGDDGGRPFEDGWWLTSCDPVESFL